MQGSPQRKKARFSEHPQIFEYSSKSKKQVDVDDSLLLDMNDQQTGNPQTNKVDQVHEIDSNVQRQLEIDQITCDLAQIQAYLQQDSKPIETKPIQQQVPLTPDPKPKTEKYSQRFSINLKPELRSGRETMNIEQQTKLKSTIKQLSDDISNNKRRAMEQIKQQRQKQMQRNKDKPNMQQRIQNELKKNKRITMDIKQLMSIINQYGNDDEQKKMREDRKNRITMDVFALSKLMQNVQQQNQEYLNQGMTPVRNIQRQRQRSFRKTNIFSTFKQNPQPSQIKLFVNSYINQAPKRLQQKQAQSKKLAQFINQLRSELVKTELKISDCKKRIEKRANQKQLLEKKIKVMTDEIQKKRYLEDIQYIRSVQMQYRMNILKYQVDQNGYYGHFSFDGIYMKIKSKTKTGPTDIKLMVSQQAKQNEKYFLISIQDSIKLVKKYHSSTQTRQQHFLSNVIRIIKAYRITQKLDNNLYYLSLNFELKQFQLNSTLDKFNFQLYSSPDRFLLVQVNMGLYLEDELNPDSITIYDPKKPGYLQLNYSNKQNSDGNSNVSVIFEKIKIIVRENLL